MDKKLSLALNADFPEMFLFRNFRGKPNYFVVECGDGWYNLIYKMFEQIRGHIKRNNEYYHKLQDAEELIKAGRDFDVPTYIQRDLQKFRDDGGYPVELDYPEVRQIKEKFGTLTIYLNGVDEYIKGAWFMTQAASESICEECGNKGKTGNSKHSNWVKTLCDPCREARDLQLEMISAVHPA